ncbi:IS3 family transposase [Arcanobacterium phocae]|nr:IS3 family transposase [Arcanobacterium phocae]
MSRKGNSYDNSLAENFFDRLKAEFYHPDIFTTVEKFIAGLDEYIA